MGHPGRATAGAKTGATAPLNEKSVEWATRRSPSRRCWRRVLEVLMDPKKSDTMRIALGRTQDAFNRVPFIEFHDGNITFQPGQSMRDTFTAAKAAFPPGARLEYRIETGDMYIDGDRGQALGRSLWVIKPDGTRELLVRGFNIYVDFELANLHLKSAGIPFQV